MTTSPDITHQIPFDLPAAKVAVNFQSSGIRYDVSIGGVPFLLAPNDENPYTRTTVEYRKQQFDNSTEPGEQSLSQWWTRSQDSWHRGGGIIFYEPGSDELTRNRFSTSFNIDPWTRGRVSLVKSVAIPTNLTVSSSQAASVCGAVVGGVNFIYALVNGALKKYDGTTLTDFTGESGAVTGPIVAGNKIVVGTSTGTQTGDLSGTAVSNAHTNATATVTPYFVKNRLILATGTKLYETTIAGQDLTTLTALITHPASDWIWSSVAEAPAAILASGYSNGVSSIYKFTLKDTGTFGSNPTLNNGVVVASFPPGEEVHSIYVYLGTYVAIGTSKGVRIGIVDANGDITYGPIIVPTTNPVRAFNARDRFVYAGITNGMPDGNSGIARIDLSEQIGDGTLRFAWAYDVSCAVTGQVTSVAFLGTSDRVAFGVNDRGVFLQSATAYVASGYLNTGRIRFATTEPKVFSLAKVRSSITSTATISLGTVSESGVLTSLLNMTAGFDDNEDISLGTISETTLPFTELRLTLNASGDTLVTPVLEALQVKGLPQPSIQRRIEFPLLCMDHEEDTQRARFGYRGAAYDRIAALEDLEDSRAVVVIDDSRTGESFAGRIEQIRFVNIQPPDKNQPNFGGRVNVVVTKL